MRVDNPEAFLKVWTLKEAWLKATGRGIADNLQTLIVTADLELSGDRPLESWRASLGRSGDHLVAVVYQGDFLPDGFTIGGQIDLNNPGFTEAGIQSIEWMFHKQIHSASQLT